MTILCIIWMAFRLCKFYTVEIEVKKITLIMLSAMLIASSAFAADSTNNTAKLNAMASAWKTQTVTGLQHKPNLTVVYGGRDITATSDVNPQAVA